MNITSGILNKCLEECDKSIYKVRIGCIIFKGKKIISSGHNEIRSNSISLKYKLFINSLHAEQSAILKVNDWSTLKGCSILVIKTSKTLKQLSNARPCKICSTLLNHVGIKNIYYSDSYSQIVKIKSSQLKY